MRPAAALLLGALLAGCATELRGEPLEGRESRGFLQEGAERLEIPWPDAFRRGARFVVVNRTARPIETLFVNLAGKGQPREIAAVTVEDPPGAAATVLPDVGFSLRAQVGAPGSVLIPPGGSARFVVVVDGAPGIGCRATITVPGAR